MLITKLKLIDFMCYENNEFEFTPGINTILGRNGSGKSAILTAIAIVLFSYAPIHLNKLVRNGKKNSTLELTFEHENSKYKITRIFGSTSKCLVEKDGKIIINKLAEFQSFLTDIFSQNIQSIRESLYLRSNDLTYLFLTDKRKIIIESILGLSDYEVVYNNLKEMVSNLQKKIDALELQKALTINKLSLLVDYNIEELIKTQESLKKEIDFYENYLQKAREDTNKRISSLIREIDKLNKSISEIDLIPLNELLSDEERLSSLIIDYRTAKNNECPTCGQLLINNKYILEGIEEEIFLLKSKLVNGIAKSDNNEFSLHKLKSEKEEVIREKVIEESKLNQEPILGYMNKLEQLKLEYLKRDVKIDLVKQSSGNIEELKNTIQNLTTTIQSYEKKKERLIFFRDGFKQMGPLISKIYVEEIGANASYIISNILETDFNIKVNEDYSLVVSTENGELLFQQLSEGQRALAAIATRLAMARLTRFNIIFLDEVTANLDTTTKEFFAQNIVNFGFSQVFNISHDSSFSDYAGNIIRV